MMPEPPPSRPDFEAPRRFAARKAGIGTGLLLANLLAFGLGGALGAWLWSEKVVTTEQIHATDTVTDHLMAEAPCVLRVPMIQPINRELSGQELRDIEDQFPQYENVDAKQGEIAFGDGDRIQHVIVSGFDCPPYERDTEATG